MNTAAAAARDAARRRDGKFGVQRRGEPDDIDLDPDRRGDLPDDLAALDDWVDQPGLDEPTRAARREHADARQARWGIERSGLLLGTPKAMRALDIRDEDLHAGVTRAGGLTNPGRILDGAYRHAENRRGPMCPEHGGRWGFDEHCDTCTDVAAMTPRPLPDHLDPQYWREQAGQSRRNSHESFARSDTDGALTQWASDTTANQHLLQAEIAANGGKAQFPALYTVDGQPTTARLASTHYGSAWVIDNEDAPNGQPTWVNRSRASTAAKQDAAMGRKGYREGYVWAPAKADLAGSGTGLSGALSVRAVTKRTSYRPEDAEFAGWETDD